MQYTHFMDKYPVHHTEILKSATCCASVDELIQFFRDKVEADPRACFIAEFDHYAHTASLPEGEIAENIKAAKHIIFCFGLKLPSPLAMGPRPRSIGVCELDDSFAISFLEAPNPVMHQIMLDWVADLETSKAKV
ncbi:MAG: hypothetical protein M0Q98_14675 [Pseudomonas sp.]|jgi:hypothetical protein|nr:hypothetical protein [Pseudomonas sp.]MDD2223292.1 hypothetical protein [Pseudomonas sp.]MDY0415068.1 hypothetical protein [Pseudomonas sp.]NLO54018.1 hypothetical protein [Gammaproteobacteria bacterium]